MDAKAPKLSSSAHTRVRLRPYSSQEKEGRGTTLKEFIHHAGNLLGRDPNRWERLSQQVIEANVYELHRSGIQNTDDLSSFDTAFAPALNP